MLLVIPYGYSVSKFTRDLQVTLQTFTAIDFNMNPQHRVDQPKLLQTLTAFFYLLRLLLRVVIGGLVRF